MVVADTSPQVRRRVAAVYASMTGAQRVRLAAEMADEVRTVALAGIRARNPGSDGAEVHAAWLRMLHGVAVVDELIRSIESARAGVDPVDLEAERSVETVADH